MMNIIKKSRLDSIVSTFVTVHPHEIPPLLHSSSSFFFILSAYFVVLPLRDEGAISLGLSNLPSLFIGSLFLTLIAAPLSSLIFSFPNLSKSKALVFIHRFFSLSLIAFFILWQFSSSDYSKGFVAKEDRKDFGDKSSSVYSLDWDKHGWFYVSVRIGFFLWVALLNLITISSTWARVIDVMDNESGLRLFGFIGAGATLGQLFGSLFATAMAWLGPFLLLFAALLMEFAARFSEGINQDMPLPADELSLISEADPSHETDAEGQDTLAFKGHSPKSTSSAMKLQPWAILDGLILIMSSTYLMWVALFLCLGAIISSFFYLQKVSIIAITVTSSIGRRRLFAQINSFIAVFILAGQLTVTGHILTIAGVTIAICAAPSVAFLNLVAIAVWPTWIAIAVCETLRKVITYVVTRPGRELLFTVVSQDEKYKAKICIDVFVQRLGDATAAGMYKLLFSTLHGKTSTVSLYALPICLLWIVTAFYLGRRQAQLAQLQIVSGS